MLDGWAFDCAIATKYTAVPSKWLQYCSTVFAPIKILAGIGGHFFIFCKAAGWAGDSRTGYDCFSHLFFTYYFISVAYFPYFSADAVSSYTVWIVTDQSHSLFK